MGDVEGLEVVGILVGALDVGEPLGADVGIVVG